MNKRKPTYAELHGALSMAVTLINLMRKGIISEEAIITREEKIKAIYEAAMIRKINK
jgi:hypothetical protein